MLTLITPPVEEPVTLDEAKLAARIDGDALDAVLPGLITSARRVAEQETGRGFIQQTWRKTLDAWPCASGIVVPVFDVTAMAATYWDGAAWTSCTELLAHYPTPNGERIAPAVDAVAPAFGVLVDGAPRVRIDFTLGAANAAGVDECIKLYIKAQVAFWVRNPEAANERAMTVSPFLAGLLDPARSYA